jgi:hypothetical protein
MLNELKQQAFAAGFSGAGVGANTCYSQRAFCRHNATERNAEWRRKCLWKSAESICADWIYPTNK